MGTLQTKYERFLVSGFIEDFLRIGQKLHKITHNSMKKRVALLTNLVGVHPRNFHKNLKQIRAGVREKKSKNQKCSRRRRQQRRRRRRQRRRTQSDR